MGAATLQMDGANSLSDQIRGLLKLRKHCIPAWTMRSAPPTHLRHSGLASDSCTALEPQQKCTEVLQWALQSQCTTA